MADEAPGQRVTAGASLVLAWLLLALLNRLLAELLLPDVSSQARWLHHAYDAGQLLALGALSWLLVQAARFAGARLNARWRERSRLLQAGFVAVIVFAVGLAVGSDDVSNYAERTDVPQWLATLALASVFALALGASRLLYAPRQIALRFLLASLGLTAAVGNALSLKGAYFACHFMLAGLAAILLANALEGLRLPAWSRRAEQVVLGLAALAGLVSVAVAPRGDVRLRLYSLPSSVLAPLLASFLADEQELERARVPARYRDSPWFRDRSAFAPIPATRALAPSKPPIVMFFTIDAFRADVLEQEKYRKSLPALSKLRRSSTYFTTARSPTASTMTTMASTFNGKHFSQIRWTGIPNQPVKESTPGLAEILSKAGVRTLLVAGKLGRVFGKSGVARGFAKEVTIAPGGKPATATVSAIIDDLDKSSQAPLFIYAHFIEPHAPYTLAGTKGSPFERYVREIGLVDRQLRRLRNYLESKGLADHTYLIVSADHGEAFGEHGSIRHARTAYEEQVRVPLFVYVPGQVGRDVATQASLMDVGPTVLDLFGLPTPGFWMGQSLLPVIAVQTDVLERPLVVDTGYRIQAYCFDDGHKVIFSRKQHTTEVYDLKKDPGELVNLATSGDPTVETAIQTAQLFFDTVRLKADVPKGPKE